MNIRQALTSARVHPSTRLMFEKVLVLAFGHLNDQDVKVFIGFGGWKDRAHRERVERRRAEGWPPSDGLAELSGMARRSMIRARHQVAAVGVLSVVKGGGRGLANEYRLDGMPRLPGPVSGQPPAAPARGEGWTKLGDIAAALPDPRGP